MGMNLQEQKEIIISLNECDEYFGKHGIVKSATPILNIKQLLDSGLYKEVQIHLYELPDALKEFMTLEEINASINWYFKWKIETPIDEQTTCTIKRIFGEEEGVKVIVAINFYKYLRLQDYDPNVVEIFYKRYFDSKKVDNG